MDTIQQLIENLSNQFYSELEEQEGITKSDLELVDLDINFSPVIQFKGDSPVGAIETVGGNYIVNSKMPQTVNAEMLKVMRYRYLISRNK